MLPVRILSRVTSFVKTRDLLSASRRVLIMSTTRTRFGYTRMAGEAAPSPVLPSDTLDVDFGYENLVLEGGGAKGFAYIGALEVLEERGLLQKFHRFAGASAGAIITAMLAVGGTVPDLKEFSQADFGALTTDACCSSCPGFSTISLLCNIWSKYGWHSGDTFLKFIRNKMKKVAGDPDITFRQVYEKYGNELLITVSNITKMDLEFFHPKTTPDVPVAMAVRMSMSIPGYFQPVKYRLHGVECYFVDGGMLCNYPIFCFDGWYLSMKDEDCFLDNMGRIEDTSPFEGFNPKTLGMQVYSAHDFEMQRCKFQERYEGFVNPRPKTTLAKSRRKEVDKHLDQLCQRRRMIEAAQRVGKAITDTREEMEGTLAGTIKRETFLAAMQKVDIEDRRMFFEEEDDMEKAFDMLDEDGDGKVYMSNLIRYLDDKEIAFKEMMEGSLGNVNIGGVSEYAMANFSTLMHVIKMYYLKSEDVGRTVGIHTDYLRTMDFELETGDRQFLYTQGQHAMLGFLREKAGEAK